MYCDFYSVEGVSVLPAFLQGLHKEIDLWPDAVEGGTVETVYLGGGTPSLLSPVAVGTILDHVTRKFKLSSQAEITLETNPGTVEHRALTELRAAGVNRLSIGVQSVHPTELAFLGRIHSADDGEACVRNARRAGFGNVSVDLIYALPGQTPARWSETLTRAVEWGVPHISAYSLIVEENTPLSTMVRSGAVTPATDEEEAELFEFTMAYLAARGYEQYEVSNYALPGFRSRHNIGYWNHTSYLGFGPSAHSLRMDPTGRMARRWWNHANLVQYLGSLEQGRLPVAGEEVLGERELFNERIFLDLRADGLNLSTQHDPLPLPLSLRQRQTIEDLVKRGLARVENERVRLTSQGFVICDEIAERLMVS